jgi:hypothetical protein
MGKDGTLVPFGSAQCAENRHIRAIAESYQAIKLDGIVRPKSRRSAPGDKNFNVETKGKE